VSTKVDTYQSGGALVRSGRCQPACRPRSTPTQAGTPRCCSG